MWHSEVLKHLADVSFGANQVFEQFYQTVEEGNPDESFIPDIQHLHSEVLRANIVPATLKEALVLEHIIISAQTQKAYLNFLEGNIPIDTLVEGTYGAEALHCLFETWNIYRHFQKSEETLAEGNLEKIALNVQELLHDEARVRGYLPFLIRVPVVRITEGDPGWIAEDYAIELPKVHFYRENGRINAVHIANDLAHENGHVVHLAYAAAMPPCLSGDEGNLRSIASFPAVEGYAWFAESLAEKIAVSCGFSPEGKCIGLGPDDAQKGLDNANQRWFYLLDLCVRGYLQQKHGNKWAAEYEKLEPGIYESDPLSQSEKHRFLEYLAYPVGLRMVRNTAETLEGPLWLKTALLSAHASFALQVYPKAVAYASSHLPEFLDYLSGVLGRDMQKYYKENR